MLGLNSLDSSSNFTTLKACQSPEMKFSILTLLEITATQNKSEKAEYLVYIQ